MKRFIDLLFALFLLIITLPILLLIAILIKLDSPGSILYLPVMVGQNGNVFSLYRFRTMSAHTSNQGSEHKPTRVGAFLRNYSLDHLPMLINLLKGDLTIVGPRPMELNVVNLQDPIWRDYFQVKPGLFNYAVLKLGKLWMPSRGTHPMLNQELELEYRQKRSPALDLHLFVEFLHVLMTSHGNVKARGEPDAEVEKRVRKQ